MERKIKIPDGYKKQIEELLAKEKEVVEKLREVDKKINEFGTRLLYAKHIVAKILNHYPALEEKDFEEYKALISLREEYQRQLEEIINKKEELAKALIKEIIKQI